MALTPDAQNLGDPLTLEQHDDDQGEDQRDDKIEQPEHNQRR